MMAGAFRFRLEAVGRVRRHALDAQRRAVAQASRALGEVEDRIAQLTRALRETVDQSRDARLATRLDLLALRHHQFFHGQLHQRLLGSHKELARRREGLSREQVKLGEAMKQVKVIEKLRERQWTRCAARQRRHEQAMVDEAALQAFRSGRDRSRRASEVSS